MPKIMVSRGNAKKKRKGDSSLVLEDSPKRPRVQAQRKFAQGSNINTPDITPHELENGDKSKLDFLPAPVELLPIKRPNTEDFLTFLCFRGTPVLPPTLNFFNTASFVDTNGQVHEIKSEGTKNGPIDTPIIAKSGCGSSEKPFIAFGVRKRADPVIINRQMDKKRRHALALQALRRKYQEQKMAKIRAVTISKLSEKITNKTLVKTNSLLKLAKTDAKKMTIQRTRVIATKHIKVTSTGTGTSTSTSTSTTRQTVKTTMRPMMKPKMCLRSFRGRFIQKELPFHNQKVKKKVPPGRKIIEKVEKRVVLKKKQFVPAPTKLKTKSQINQKRKTIEIINSNKTKPERKTVTEKLSSAREKAAQSTQKTNADHQKPQRKVEPVSSSAPLMKVRNVKTKTVLKTSPHSAKKAKTIVLRNEKSGKMIKSTVTGQEAFMRKIEHRRQRIAMTSDRVLRNPKRAEARSQEPKQKFKSNLKRPPRPGPNLRESGKKSAVKKVETGQKVAPSKRDEAIEGRETRGAKSCRKEDAGKNEDIEKSDEVLMSRKVIKSLGSNKNAKGKDDEGKESSLNDELKESAGKEVIKPCNNSNVKDEVKKEDEENVGKKASKSVTSNINKSTVKAKDEAKEIEVPVEDELKESISSKIVTTKDGNKSTAKAKDEVKAIKEATLTDELKENSSTKVTKPVTIKTRAKEEVKVPADALEENPCKKAIKSVSQNKATTKSKDAIKEVKEVKEIKEQFQSSAVDKNLKSIKILKKHVSNKPVTPASGTDDKTRPQKTHKELRSSCSKGAPKEEPETKKDEPALPESEKPKLESGDGREGIEGPPEERPAKQRNQPRKPEQACEARAIPPRPSRKTKEAAAIYMEILSHKLVGEGKADDDSVSIDSFPELPNVKRTEQKENEFRAKSNSKAANREEAATPAPAPAPLDKESKKAGANKRINSDEKEEASASSDKAVTAKKVNSDPKEDTSAPSDKNTNKKISCVKKIDTDTTSPGDEAQTKQQDKQKELRVIVDKSSIPPTPAPAPAPKLGAEGEKNKCESLKKVPADESRSESKDSLQIKTITARLLNEERKSSASDKESGLAGRSRGGGDGSRGSGDNEPLKKVQQPGAKEKKNDLPDKLPQQREAEKRKPAGKKEKTATRSKESRRGEPATVPVVKENEVVKVKERTKRSRRTRQQTTDSDDSDESFYADVKIPRKKQVTRSKTPKLYANFSDSDSDSLDLYTVEAIREESKPKPDKPDVIAAKEEKKKKDDRDAFSDSDEEPLVKLTNKPVALNRLKEPAKTDGAVDKMPVALKDSTQTSEKVTKREDAHKPDPMGKPKRECTKRNQNYFPLFSSSDDEDLKYFYGFGSESRAESPAVAAPVVVVVDDKDLPDLSSKDIDRRYGKRKVNMSNEQIEQWLQDSALANKRAGKETETETYQIEFEDDGRTKTSLPVKSSSPSPSTKNPVSAAQAAARPKTREPESEMGKPQNLSPDKKLIFRREKKVPIPNSNAFSVNNESSIYAFGEENEERISTPFRRPVRRPSSSCTSRSEEESKIDDGSKSGCFRKPSLLKHEMFKQGREENVDESQSGAENADDSHPGIKVPPAPHSSQKSKPGDRKVPRDPFEDPKYRLPGSPSTSSTSSSKLNKKQPPKVKTRSGNDVINPVRVPSFPGNGLPALLTEAPSFYPIDKEFQDPLEYIEKIRPKAEQFGICKIVPPSSFKPECKVSDDMRFTAYNQYVHKMLHRWGPNFKELMAIKKYLDTQNISLTHSPLIGGMEIDLPRLYQTVQMFGGLKEVIEKKKWPKVSEHMKIPKSAQDRVTKLDDIYCKYLLPYDTLSPVEREKLFEEVENEWAKRESRILSRLQSKEARNQQPGDECDDESETEDEAEECIVKGRNVALNAFYRIARNTMAMWFKNTEPQPQEVEQEFWKHVTQKQNHICVHSGSIDSGSCGYGFAVSKNSPFARNAWNLKVLTNNSGSVLRSMGPVMGVTVPTLHVGMVFSACCWYRDPHSLPWIEYLHTGGSKIWYGIPDSASEPFHAALNKLVPGYCKNKSLWLTSDTTMVPPDLLIENGVSLSRIVQEPGQYVVVFPRAFTSSVSTGYVVSESVYFAPPHWLKTAEEAFNNMRNCCEPSMLSLERLLVSIVQDGRSNVEVLRQVAPLVEGLCERERAGRGKLREMGLEKREKLPVPDAAHGKKKRSLAGEEGDYECEICRKNLFISMVTELQENGLYCIDHALELLGQKKIQMSDCKLLFTYDDEELSGLCDKIKVAIENKQQKKSVCKFSDLPTMVKY